MYLAHGHPNTMFLGAKESETERQEPQVHGSTVSTYVSQNLRLHKGNMEVAGSSGRRVVSSVKTLLSDNHVAGRTVGDFITPSSLKT